MINKPFTYLACPYSHPDKEVMLARFHAVNAKAAEMMAQGLIVFSPISHSHSIAQAGALPKNWAFWERHDRAYLEHSNHLAVFCLPGWHDSTGVTAEIKFAMELGISISYHAPANCKHSPYFPV